MLSPKFHNYYTVQLPCLHSCVNIYVTTGIRVQRKGSTTQVFDSGLCQIGSYINLVSSVDNPATRKMNGKPCILHAKTRAVIFLVNTIQYASPPPQGKFRGEPVSATSLRSLHISPIKLTSRSMNALNNNSSALKREVRKLGSVKVLWV